MFLTQHWKDKIEAMQRRIERLERGNIQEPVKNSGTGTGSKNHCRDPEVQFLRENFHIMTDKAIGEYLGRTENAIQQKRVQLGLTMTSAAREKRMVLVNRVSGEK